VVTPPARAIFYKQAVTLMRTFKNVFRNAKLFLVFHRGMKSDKYTSRGEARYLQKLKREAEKMNYQTVNAAYDASKIEFYRKCDLHVGYRVHGHIYFLSMRKPSFLLQEDGRGLGLSKSLGLPDVPARGHKISESIYQLASLPTRVSNVLDRVLSNIVIHPSVLRDAVETLLKNIRREHTSGFPRFRNLSKLIDGHYYPIMSEFLKTLP
jgi:polysaccharide pyruvyl transferase WcaK-like protein